MNTVTPVINRVIQQQLQSELIKQDYELAHAGVFEAPKIKDLPEEMSFAKPAVTLARKLGPKCSRNAGLIFGGAALVLGFAGMAIATQDVTFSLIFSLVISLFAGFCFARMLSPFMRFVLLPIKTHDISRWQKSVESVGYYSGSGNDQDPDTIVYSPSFKLGKASGPLNICKTNGMISFIVAPAANMVKIIRAHKR